MISTKPEPSDMTALVITSAVLPDSIQPTGPGELLGPLPMDGGNAWRNDATGYSYGE